ncbi:MAG: hypothetical protein ABEH90_01655 [Halolamina sp.]
MPSRRTYLASLPALVTAGCTSDPGQSKQTPDRPSVTVEATAVQYAYRHVWQVDWNDIRAADGQFVFVTIDASDADETYLAEQFRLVADGERYARMTFDRNAPADPEVPGPLYGPGREHGPSRRGWLCFPTPATLESAPRLSLDGEWEWPLDAPKATDAPPEWEFTVDVPETVAPDETFDLAVSAENVGDGPGVFRGAVNFSSPLHRPEGFDIPLDPGASGTATVEATAEAESKLRYGIRTPVRDTEVMVDVQGETATGTDTG